MGNSKVTYPISLEGELAFDGREPVDFEAFTILSPDAFSFELPIHLENSFYEGSLIRTVENAFAGWVIRNHTYRFSGPMPIRL